MKFTTTALAQAARKALAADATRWAQSQAAEHDQQHQAGIDWVDRHRDEWLVAMRKAATKLRKGQPLTPEDLPEDRYNNRPVLFRPTRRSYAGEYKPPGELLSLVAVLDAAGQDTVTTANLRELGISPGTLRFAIAHLAKSIDPKEGKG